MKPIRKIVHLLTPTSTLVATLALLVWLPGTLPAQEKGAERLMKLQPARAAHVHTVGATDTATMTCPKCTDVWVKVAQPMGKGGRMEMATVQHHECPGCNTTLTTHGSGKQAKTVAQHTCTHCGTTPASCCRTTGTRAGTR